VASDTLLLCGLLLLGYAGAWQLGLVPGSRISLPAPAVTESTPPEPPSAPIASLPAQVVVAPILPLLVPEAWQRPPLPADRPDQQLAAPVLFEPAYAVRLAIPSIGLRAGVVQAATRRTIHGLEWETVPFAAAHYGDLTARIGAPGNAVIAAHATTLESGNVFWNLYKVRSGTEVEVRTEDDRVRRYVVTSIKLVLPTDLAAMAPTSEEQLTLITCGGEFDPVTTEFTHRLVVVARPVPPLTV
jgi:LPXTG-site transpeptidase (sortase) family protein